MPAIESSLETSVMMSDQLVVSATVSSMLISHPRAAESRPFRLPRATSRFAGQIVPAGTEVDARARAAILRAAPMNRELTVRADRRERAEN